MPQDTKIFRDPVYGLVSFDKEKSRPLLDLIDCLEVQRLKRIRQLGLSCFTFPSATHDRFSHSLGMAYLVGLILDQLDFGDSVQIPDEEGEYQDLTRDEFKLLLQMAALLHDVGHGPFSHAFEQATGIKHEKLTQDIIQDNETQVNQTLCTIERKVLKKNAVGWLTGIINGTFPLFWARDLISSQVDADRMDYLLRDAYMCGVNYVSFDRQWIINNMTLAEIPQENNRKGLVVNARKGVHSLESFIISRYHMYEQVYFHKTTRGFEKLLMHIFKRVRQLLDQGKEVHFINEQIHKVFSGSFKIKDFLFLDDFVIITQLQLWQDNSDRILQTLCNAFVSRQPYKMFKEDNFTPDREFYRKMDDLFDDKEQSDYFFFEDDYINNPYKDEYLLGKSKAEDAGHIWLLRSDGDIAELSTESTIIGSLRNQINRRTRAYIHRYFVKKLKEKGI
jgi:hypothetical protein